MLQMSRTNRTVSSKFAPLNVTKGMIQWWVTCSHVAPILCFQLTEWANREKHEPSQRERPTLVHYTMWSCEDKAISSGRMEREEEHEGDGAHPRGCISFKRIIYSTGGWGVIWRTCRGVRLALGDEFLITTQPQAVMDVGLRNIKGV